MSVKRTVFIALSAGFVWAIHGATAQGARVTVELGNANEVTFVGALNRWDQDGNPRRPVNTKAKIDAPEVDAVASSAGGGKWVFSNLPPGKYDLVIVASGRLRVEGWSYAPVLEFDPFFPARSTVDPQVRQIIDDDIEKSPHYENRVEALAMGGDEKVVRVLVMLVRDKPTSYESDMPGAATLRHEIWQYTLQYGTWSKEKRTRVLDRILLGRDQLRRWTWVWDPALGEVEVKDSPVTVSYTMPGRSARALKGLYPY
jgi:hypothetical protein